MIVADAQRWRGRRASYALEDWRRLGGRLASWTTSAAWTTPPADTARPAPVAPAVRR